MVVRPEKVTRRKKRKKIAKLFALNTNAINTECIVRSNITKCLSAIQVFNRKAIKYCPCLCLHEEMWTWQMLFHPGKCSCIDMGLRCADFGYKNATTQKLPKKLMMKVFLTTKQLMTMIDSFAFFMCYTIFYYFSSRLFYVIVLMKRLNSNSKSKIHLI